MTQYADLVALADDAAEQLTLTDELVEEPDCLAELEYTFSVFRFRYSWGTVFEITFSGLADAADRRACMALIPGAHVYLESVHTETLGRSPEVDSGHEVTHRFVTADV